MKGNERKIADHDRKFIPVYDSCNRRVSGLQMRVGVYYGSIWAAGLDGRKIARKFRLRTPEGVPCGNLAEAKAARDLLVGAKQTAAPPAAGRKPGFSAARAHPAGGIRRLKPAQGDADLPDVDPLEHRQKNRLKPAFLPPV